VTVADKPLAAFFRRETSVGRKQFGNLGFDGLGEQLPRAALAELQLRDRQIHPAGAR
jgi:hypothetical protein